MKHTVVLLLAAGILLGPLTIAFGQMAEIPACPSIPSGPSKGLNAQSAKTAITFSKMSCAWNYGVTGPDGIQTGSCVVTGTVTFSQGNGQNLSMPNVKLASFPDDVSESVCSAICNGATSGCP